MPFGRYCRGSPFGFVGTALPRVLWIAEADLDVRGRREALVIGHVLVSIPGQRFVEFPRALAGVLDQALTTVPVFMPTNVTSITLRVWRSASVAIMPRRLPKSSRPPGVRGRLDLQ